jgi:hypothetical protein
MRIFSFFVFLSFGVIISIFKLKMRFMGTPVSKELMAVILTFNDVKRGDYPALPVFPNGRHYLTVNPDGSFTKVTPVWQFGLKFGEPGIHASDIGVWVFWIGGDGDTAFKGWAINGVDDLYRVENDLVDWWEAWYGGYCTIMPVYVEDVVDDLNNLAAGLRMDGMLKVFAESMGAAGSKRAIRLAKQSDGTCCHFVLPPITSWSP